jgi:hypothetical protein
MIVKISNIYSDKFTLSVIDLSKIELATEEDKAYGIDEWAKLFKATTWEELKTMASQNTIFDNVAQAMFMYSSDPNVIEQCRRVEDHQRFMAYQDNKIKSLEADNSKLEADNNKLVTQNSELEAENALLKAELAKAKHSV